MQRKTSRREKTIFIQRTTLKVDLISGAAKQHGPLVGSKIELGDLGE